MEATLSRDRADAPPISRSFPAKPIPSITCEHLKRSFGERDVLKDVSFDVRRGEIFGLIGPSGSGKTTLIKCMIGELRPTAGRVTVAGVEPTEWKTTDRERIGYVPQGFVLYPNLSVEQNARFVAGLYGMGWLARRRRTRELLERFGLWEARKRLAQNISGGMQRRLSLACALLHSPDVLFVDEPTAGLDPVLRVRVREQLAELRDEGRTVVVTTQNLEDAAHCDRIGLMQDGRLGALGTPKELQRQALGGIALDIEAPEIERVQTDELHHLSMVNSVQLRGWGSVRVIVDDAPSAIPVITDWLRDRGITVEAVHVHEPTFEDVFMALVQEKEGDVA